MWCGAGCEALYDGGDGEMKGLVNPGLGDAALVELSGGAPKGGAHCVGGVVGEGMGCGVEGVGVDGLG